MGFGNEYAVGIGGWRVHYDSCEVDYRQLKDDIAAILSGEMRFLAAFAGDGDFLALAREGSWRRSVVRPRALSGWQPSGHWVSGLLPSH